MTRTTDEAVPVDHQTWMGLAATEYARLLDLLGGLDPAEWERQTDCPAWDVRAMVAHLVGAAEANARVREMVRQAAVGRRRFPRPMLVDSMTSLQVADREDRTPPQLMADLADAGRRGVAARSRIPGVVRAVVLPMGAPLGTRPLGYLMDCIYTRDAWMHRIDIARATGRALEVTPGHDGILMADLVSEWETLHEEDFDLVLTGPAGLRHSRGTSGVRIELDAIEFARTLSGRESGDGLLGIAVPF